MIHFPVPEALTFDDVLLLPARSDVVPATADTRTQHDVEPKLDIEPKRQRHRQEIRQEEPHTRLGEPVSDSLAYPLGFRGKHQRRSGC